MGRLTIKNFFLFTSFFLIKRLHIKIKILKLFTKLNKKPANNSTLLFPKKGFINKLEIDKKYTANEDSKEDKILNPNKLLFGKLIFCKNFIFLL